MMNFKYFKLIAVSLLVAGGLSACATEGDVNAPASALPQVEESQQVTEFEDEDSNLEPTEDTVSYTDADLVDFNIDKAYSYSDNSICSFDSDENLLAFTLEMNQGIPITDDDEIYLFEVANYETGELSEFKPLASAHKDFEVKITLPFEERFLFERFVPTLLHDGKYVPISDGKYLTNPEAISTNKTEYPNQSSKKGILLDAATLGKEELTDLNVKRVVYNIPLSLLIGESESEACPTIYFDYNGVKYPFNGYRLAGFDSLFQTLYDGGYHVTAIILNDWNEEDMRLIHPMSRKKTYKSMYYAFNTEEEEGVRLLEATALFLANRYSGGECGMVYDWVIANEVNQQRIWNYMDTDDLEYYTESFEKSFRTFYNAIKSAYGSARVYYSLDHDWNDNDGRNNKFFNGRDFLYQFNEIARRGGNYDWSLSIHPYAEPLPKVNFWEDLGDKSEEARVVTPMNLSSLTDVLSKDEFLNSKEQVRGIGVTELGFSSKAGERLQAAAYAYCYYIMEDNAYIDSFLMNRQTDDAESLKSGLALGIYNSDYSPKYIKDVFANVDNRKGKEYLPEMLEIIGAESLEEALSWARVLSPNREE